MRMVPGGVKPAVYSGRVLAGEARGRRGGSTPEKMESQPGSEVTAKVGIDVGQNGERLLLSHRRRRVFSCFDVLRSSDAVEASRGVKIERYMFFFFIFRLKKKHARAPA